MSKFFTEKLVGDSLKLYRYRHEHEGPVDAYEELKGLVTALFFPSLSAKSRKFTRQLRLFYKTVNWAHRRFEVVFVADASEEEDTGMEHHGDWLYTVHDNRNGHRDCPVCKLQRCYKLHDAPYMALIDSNGDIVRTGAVEDILDCFDNNCYCFGLGPIGRMSERKADMTVDYWCWMVFGRKMERNAQ